jgi:cytochrome c peroxidase
MKKKVLVAVGIVVLVVVAFPISNSLRARAADPVLLERLDDPEAREMANRYAESCMDCHSGRTELPFYASWPGARSLIQADIEKARSMFDMERELFDPAVGVTEAALAKIQRETAAGEMPLASYTAMHWRARWTAEDQQAQAAWARHVRARRDGAEDLDDPIYDRPIYPLKRPGGLDDRKVALGEAMYHDVRLSGDDTISCASCHDLTKGGTDQERVSTGVGGQKGGINAPTTFNAVYNLAQFWNGRAADLAAQADGPPNNPIEMATNWEQVLGKLRQDPQVVEGFAAAYGELSPEAIRDAIAVYEATLVTPNDGLDRFLRGDESALTAGQKRGWTLFSDVGCSTCHVGPAMGGTSYEKMGLHGNYMADRGDESDADLGRYAVTGDEHDTAHFKVPTLRNVALTYPYYHDGTVDSLDQAVRKMGHYERGRELTDNEVTAIIALLGALTGELPTPPVAAGGGS